MSESILNRKPGLFVSSQSFQKSEKRQHPEIWEEKVVQNDFGTEYEMEEMSRVEVPEIKPSSYFSWRIWLDRFFAILLLIPGLPIMAVVATLLILTSDGPILYCQRRVGIRGKVFPLMKFRTMIRDAEKKTGPVWTSVNDPRITKLGKLLRPTHLDELPQLFNVLMGQMALIGPRPERPEFTCHLEREIPGYSNRSLIIPGVTGLAQVNLPPDSDLESVRRKLTLDLEYIQTANFKLDFQLFLCTFLRLLCIRGDVCLRWTHVLREVNVPDYMRKTEGTTETVPATFVDQERKMHDEEVILKEKNRGSAEFLEKVE
ncbi:MAG: sugar transferase [Planctomycetia bacterium]|nr:sugar transferase [Planctomycetia bacterium]